MTNRNFRKPKIGFAPITLKLYREKATEYLPGMNKFFLQLTKILSQEIKICPSYLIFDQATAGQAWQYFYQEGVEGVIIVFLSYGTSLSLLPALKQTTFPLLLWNTQKLKTVTSAFQRRELMENHGIHGVQDLASVLLREKVNFSLITGHWTDKKTLQEIKAWSLAAAVSHRLSEMLIGRIGSRFEEMGDFALPDDWLTEKLGPRVVDLDGCFLQVKTSGQRKSQNSRWPSEFIFDRRVTEPVKQASFLAASRLEKLMLQEKLAAVAVNFAGLKPGQVMPFLGICQLMATGYGYGGEGDIFSATAVLLAQIFSGGKATFTEMFTADFLRNRVLMNHLGEANFNLKRPTWPIRLVVNPMTLGNKTATLVPVFTLRPALATLINLTGTSDGLRFIVSRARIVRGPSLSLESPHFFVRPEQRLSDFLTAYSLAGGSHHLALAFGDCRQNFRYLAQIKGIELVEI
ncbi:MAG: hypothetical protein NC911_08750 [Candidatus Omnitrophica bacterium]|nr:hypothetical protein [Candidatus Omnitrophota bacterium]